MLTNVTNTIIAITADSEYGHEDAGQISKREAALVQSVRPILGIGSELETVFVHSAHVKDIGAMPDLSWRHCFWTIQALNKGELP